MIRNFRTNSYLRSGYRKDSYFRSGYKLDLKNLYNFILTGVLRN